MSLCKIPYENNCCESCPWTWVLIVVVHSRMNVSGWLKYCGFINLKHLKYICSTASLLAHCHVSNWGQNLVWLPSSTICVSMCVWEKECKKERGFFKIKCVWDVGVACAFPWPALGLVLMRSEVDRKIWGSIWVAQVRACYWSPDLKCHALFTLNSFYIQVCCWTKKNRHWKWLEWRW